jgi:hypothetical protein
MPIRSVLAATAVLILASACGSDAEPASTPSEPATSSPASPSASEHEPPAPQDIGTAFKAFARGGDVPPMDHEVALYLGNALTGVVTPGLAADRMAWATCTEVGDYAGRACPISPVRVLKKHPRVGFSNHWKSHCLQTYGPIPPDLRTLDRIAIVPLRGTVDSCIDDFAVLLFVNDRGQLVAVSTLLGEP